MLDKTMKSDILESRLIKLNKIYNKAIFTSILELEDRAKLNVGIRRLALTTKKGFGEMWNLLYKNLRYKFHMQNYVKNMSNHHQR